MTTSIPLLERIPLPRRKLLRRMVSFGVVSGLATIADLGLFNLLLIHDATPLLVATTLAYTLGMVTSYFLNRRFTFEGRRDSRAHEVGIFVLINVVGLALNNGTVVLFAGLIGRGRLILNLARILAAALTWAFKFVAMQQWVFPSRPAATSLEPTDPQLTGEGTGPS